MTYLQTIERFYGPYARKSDRREFVRVFFKDNRVRSISYSKFLVEVLLDRELDPHQETIDHIDGDFTNNAWTNLRVVSRNNHTKEDAIYVKKIKMECVVCRKPVYRKPNSIVYAIKTGRAGPFCSKSCAGTYGALVQKNIILKSNQQNPPRHYFRKKKKNVQSVAQIPDVVLFDQARLIATLVQRTDNLNAENQCKKQQSRQNKKPKTKKPRLPGSCLICNKLLTANQKLFCSTVCAHKGQRRAAWPSPEKLERLVWKYPTSRIAHHYGVSDKTVEKWCKRYNISKPPRGYWAKNKLL